MGLTLFSDHQLLLPFPPISRFDLLLSVLEVPQTTSGFDDLPEARAGLSIQSYSQLRFIIAW